MQKTIKIGIISSAGGHLTKILLLKKWWGKYDRFWVTNKNIIGNVLKNEMVYQGYFPENRNIWNFVRNAFLALKILKREKPNVLFSTGAGIAPPFFFVGKLMNAKLIFMETFIFIAKPTLSGKIIYPLADVFIIQNKKLQRIFPKAVFKEPVA